MQPERYIQTVPAAAQTDLKMDAAPVTGTGAPQMDKCLLTNTWPKQCTAITLLTLLEP